MNILVTGGAGYIGSHIVKELVARRNNNVIVLDTLENSSRESVDDRAVFAHGSAGDAIFLDHLFKDNDIDCVMHLAGYIDAGESFRECKKYIDNNVINTKTLLTMMLKNKVKNIIFSSSAAVYGNAIDVPVTEENELNPINPYGFTKLAVERLLEHYKGSYGLKYAVFRYFNAAGAANGQGWNPNNTKGLIPKVIEAASGKRDNIKIFGTYYNTKDGTGVRDYVHVSDIVKAHVMGIGRQGIWNLGTGNGNSVREVIKRTKNITKRDFNVVESEPREGDVAVSVASNEKVKKELGWKPRYGMKEIIKSAWEWHSKNSF